jgi:hypothetical protein
LDNLRPGSWEVERGRLEGQNFQLGSSALGRRRRYNCPILRTIFFVKKLHFYVPTNSLISGRKNVSLS